jgi:hypothetical protein
MLVRTFPRLSDITESPFSRQSADQLQILYERYDLAAKHADEKNIIEVARGGAGVGLGMLASSPRRRRLLRNRLVFIDSLHRRSQ